MPGRSSLETISIGGPAYRVASATGWSVPKSVPKLGPATIILQPTPTKSLIKTGHPGRFVWCGFGEAGRGNVQGVDAA